MATVRKNSRSILENLQKEVARLQKEVAFLKENNLLDLQELRGMLKRRGLHSLRENPSQNLFFPPSFSESKKGLFYELFKKYSFRLFLREIINHQGIFQIGEVIRFSTPETGKKYLRFLIDMGLVESSGGKFLLWGEPPSSLGPTLEWFMAEVLKREFFCPALFGLRCKGTHYGGDYDVIAALEGRLLYLEVKSSPPKNISAEEVYEFLSRLQDLNPQIALFFVDTELRLLDKIVPLFAAAQRSPNFKKRESFSSGQKIGKEIFFFPPQIYIFSSKGSIIHNLALCFKHYFTFPALLREGSTF